MKTLKIEIPNGFEIDKDNSTFEQIVFKEIKNELPKTWEELGNIKGYFVHTMASIEKLRKDSKGLENVFATKEQAKASIALSQLSQLREVYRNGWVPDFKKWSKKYCIEFLKNEINTPTYEISNAFLSFQDEETRDLFLENFKDLIEQAKPLMS
ncbi:hypothetical protein [Flavobacterium sp.]|uniref:hypothetical protein n=1 Tax=Flavobacterium sp. TaxID=239 RepID=UPI003340801D